MSKKKLVPETKSEFGQPNSDPTKLTGYAQGVGVRICDRISCKLSICDMTTSIMDAFIDMPYELGELCVDNTDEINNSCMRTKFLYTLGLNVYELFEAECKVYNRKAKYFLLDSASKHVTERIVDYVYENLTGSYVEDGLVDGMKTFLMSLNHTELKSIYQYEKLSDNKSSYKTKFMAHIGQGVFNWLSPKYAEIFVNTQDEKVADMMTDLFMKHIIKDLEYYKTIPKSDYLYDHYHEKWLKYINCQWKCDLIQKKSTS